MPRYAVVKKPSYTVGAVDNALQLLILLEKEPRGIRVSDAAEHLGVAPSTAHRLLSTLVYRQFAEQDASRRYVAGPALRGEPERLGIAGLPTAVSAPLTELARSTGETVSLLRRDGTSVEFLGSVESREPLRVGERTGTVAPAHLTSGGKALLAGLDDASVRALYRSRAARLAANRLAADALDGLIAELRHVREVGYAINRELTEPGVSAIGMAVATPGAPPTVAVAVSVPTLRAERLTDAATISAIRTCCTAIGAGMIEGAPRF